MSGYRPGHGLVWIRVCHRGGKNIFLSPGHILIKSFLQAKIHLYFLSIFIVCVLLKLLTEESDLPNYRVAQLCWSINYKTISRMFLFPLLKMLHCPRWTSFKNSFYIYLTAWKRPCWYLTHKWTLQYKNQIPPPPRKYKIYKNHYIKKNGCNAPATFTGLLLVFEWEIWSCRQNSSRNLSIGLYMTIGGR